MQWHEDASCLQALTSAPPILCLQLERNTGIPRKSDTRVLLGDGEVLMPVFADAQLEVTWTSYVIIAAVMHRGRYASTGHYQAVMWGRGEVWLAEDGQTPTCHTWSMQDEADVSLLT